jgi:hypothetical protein
MVQKLYDAYVKSDAAAPMYDKDIVTVSAPFLSF